MSNLVMRLVVLICEVGLYGMIFAKGSYGRFELVCASIVIVNIYLSIELLIAELQGATRERQTDLLPDDFEDEEL